MILLLLYTLSTYFKQIVSIESKFDYIQFQVVLGQNKFIISAVTHSSIILLFPHIVVVSVFFFSSFCRFSCCCYFLHFIQSDLFIIASILDRCITIADWFDCAYSIHSRMSRWLSASPLNLLVLFFTCFLLKFCKV